jgi:S-DNA-T family DNA segregation ATPase FtsK/SpoIIIE
MLKSLVKKQNGSLFMEITKDQSDTMLKLTMKMVALGIKATFSRLEPGPIITGYYFKPNAAQPLAKLEKHEEDFALAAEQETVTIRRDKGEVIIFVPNKERKVIDFKQALYGIDMYKHSAACPSIEIPILLGVNHLGGEAFMDLTTCPHILMAGSTGSGKSTFQAAIVCSLAVVTEPSELNLYLIDTKKLDLPLFKDLPHVMSVADDINAARQVFQDLLDLTRKRYNIFQAERVRNVAEYRRSTGHKIPYRVLIIDELADLLALDKDYCDIVEDAKPIKKYLQELSQIARAAGTHIIAATQRPSVKIIDGDTKNNFPTRIGLKMPTWQDSTTVLGEPGAETLLGKGDMFVKRVDSNVLERYHGPHVQLSDISEIVNNLEAVKWSLNGISHNS